MYGTSQAIPDRTVIEDVVCGFLDITYIPQQKKAVKQ
jgi:hypothetical protein